MTRRSVLEKAAVQQVVHDVDPHSGKLCKDAAAEMW
jgi:hypothetical protein